MSAGHIGTPATKRVGRKKLSAVFSAMLRWQLYCRPNRKVGAFGDNHLRPRRLLWFLFSFTFLLKESYHANPGS